MTEHCYRCLCIIWTPIDYKNVSTYIFKTQKYSTAKQYLPLTVLDFYDFTASYHQENYNLIS